MKYLFDVIKRKLLRPNKFGPLSHQYITYVVPKMAHWPNLANHQPNQQNLQNNTFCKT